MGEGDVQAGVGGQGGQLGLPQPGAVAVGAATIGGDQQPGRLRVAGGAGGGPPAADRLDGERGGVVVGAHADPAGVGGQVVDAVRVGLAQGGVDEVVDLDLLGLPGRAPLGPAVAVRADQLLLLGVHADHRITAGQVRLGVVVEVAELGVPVGTLGALEGLGVGLQAEAMLAQQPGHRVRADPVTRAAQLGGQPAGDSVGQHNGGQGAPRRGAPTGASSAASSAGSVAVSGLRPPPARRTRPSGACPASSSATPWEILDRDAPLAWATAAIPPWPSARAPPASTNRCCRSSRCGNTAANLARNDSTTSACTATTTSWPTESQTEWLFLGRP